MTDNLLFRLNIIATDRSATYPTWTT